MTQQTGGQAVVEVLVALGVERVFGVASVHNLAIADAISRDGRIVWHPTRHEQGAVHAADGAARATGRLAVAVVSTGPGTANAMGGIYEAAFASSRVLVLTGQVDSPLLGRGDGALHEADRQADMLRSLCRRVWTVRTRAEVPAAVASVATDILTGRPKPGAVEIPFDLQMAVHDDQPVVLDLPAPLAPAAEEVEAGARLLRDARRPLVIGGGGVPTSGAEVELTALAERLGAPVLTSANGRGSIREDHDLALGPNIEQAVMARTIADADVVLAAGTRFQQMAPVQQSLRFPGRLVHVDADPTVIGRIHPTDVAVLGDAKASLAALHGALGDGESVADEDFVADALGARRRIEATAREGVGPDVGRIMDAIRSRIPDDALVVKDATIAAYVWGNRCLPVLAQRTTMQPTANGIGPGLPMAIGAAAATRRPTVLINGDGGLMLSIGELATAAELQLPLVACVFNDRGYGVLRWLQDVTYGGRQSAVDLATPDFAGVARAMGLEAETVTDPDAFVTTFTKAVASGVPWLIEVDLTRMAPMRMGIAAQPEPD